MKNKEEGCQCDSCTGKLDVEKPKMKTKILSGNVEITDHHPKPYTTNIKIDGKELTEAWIITSFMYYVNVQTGKRKLALKYYERSK